MSGFYECYKPVLMAKPGPEVPPRRRRARSTSQSRPSSLADASNLYRENTFNYINPTQSAALRRYFSSDLSDKYGSQIPSGVIRPLPHYPGQSPDGFLVPACPVLSRDAQFERFVYRRMASPPPLYRVSGQQMSQRNMSSPPLTRGFSPVRANSLNSSITCQIPYQMTPEQSTFPSDVTYQQLMPQNMPYQQSMTQNLSLNVSSMSYQQQMPSGMAYQHKSDYSDMQALQNQAMQQSQLMQNQREILSTQMQLSMQNQMQNQIQNQIQNQMQNQMQNQFQSSNQQYQQRYLHNPAETIPKFIACQSPLPSTEPIQPRGRSRTPKLTTNRSQNATPNPQSVSPLPWQQGQTKNLRQDINDLRNDIRSKQRSEYLHQMERMEPAMNLIKQGERSRLRSPLEKQWSATDSEIESLTQRQPSRPPSPNVASPGGRLNSPLGSPMGVMDSRGFQPIPSTNYLVNPNYSTSSNFQSNYSNQGNLQNYSNQSNLQSNYSNQSNLNNNYLQNNDLNYGTSLAPQITRRSPSPMPELNRNSNQISNAIWNRNPGMSSSMNPSLSPTITQGRTPAINTSIGPCVSPQTMNNSMHQSIQSYQQFSQNWTPGTGQTNQNLVKPNRIIDQNSNSYSTFNNYLNTSPNLSEIRAPTPIPSQARLKATGLVNQEQNQNQNSLQVAQDNQLKRSPSVKRNQSFKRNSVAVPDKNRLTVEEPKGGLFRRLSLRDVNKEGRATPIQAMFKSIASPFQSLVSNARNGFRRTSSIPSLNQDGLMQPPRPTTPQPGMSGQMAPQTSSQFTSQMAPQMSPQMSPQMAPPAHQMNPSLFQQIDRSRSPSRSPLPVQMSSMMPSNGLLPTGVAAPPGRPFGGRKGSFRGNNSVYAAPASLGDHFDQYMSVTAKAMAGCYGDQSEIPSRKPEDPEFSDLQESLTGRRSTLPDIMPEPVKDEVKSATLQPPQRKKSLPPDQKNVVPGKEWEREKVAKLSHAMRESRQKPPSSRSRLLRAKDWCSRQILLLAVCIGNVGVAMLFYHLFRALPIEDDDR